MGLTVCTPEEGTLFPVVAHNSQYQAGTEMLGVKRWWRLKGEKPGGASQSPGSPPTIPMMVTPSPKEPLLLPWPSCGTRPHSLNTDTEFVGRCQLVLRTLRPSRPPGGLSMLFLTQPVPHMGSPVPFLSHSQLGLKQGPPGTWGNPWAPRTELAPRAPHIGDSRPLNPNICSLTSCHSLRYVKNA